MARAKSDMPWLDMTSVPGFWLDEPMSKPWAEVRADLDTRSQREDRMVQTQPTEFMKDYLSEHGEER